MSGWRLGIGLMLLELGKWNVMSNIFLYCPNGVIR